MPSMRAIVVREFGGPEVLKLDTAPDPSPGRGQVVVRVKSAGVNPVDTYIRGGKHAIKPPLPFIPGFDAAGVVEALGPDVTGLRAGQRAYAAGVVAAPLNGSYAELVLCEASRVYPLPDRVTFAQGAGIHTPYATAARAMLQRTQVRPGEWMLVHGASGGVGTAAVQIGRLLGLRVVGTAGTDSGLELVRREGAHHAVNHGNAGYLDDIVTLTDGRGPDLVLEMLANVNLEKDLAILAPRGRICVIGNRGTIEIDPRKAMSKDAAILGVQLGNTSPDEMRSLHAFIGAGLANGTLTPVVGREFPLHDAAQAHTAVMEPGARGKIVLIT
jgi:NADPH2:quinone reductase